jgi:hypothetical protein
MDRLRELLVELKRDNYAQGNFLGLLNILIGCSIEASNGDVVSTGATWRTLAEQLKKARWTKQAATELGIELGTFAPRDRQRFWYQVIAHAGVDSPKAREAGVRRLSEASARHRCDLLRRASEENDPPPLRVSVSYTRCSCSNELQMPPQLANCLVLLIADAGGGGF